MFWNWKKISHEIQSVNVLSRGEQVAYVETSSGNFIVGSIPLIGDDVESAGILAKVKNLAEAQAKYSEMYGVR